MTPQTLSRAKKAVMKVIDAKPMTVADTVGKASKNTKMDANDVEGAVYILLHKGEVRLDGHYRLTRAAKRTK